MPHYFFALLRDTLELTFSRFKGLEIVRKIPCPGHNGEKCKHEFDLEDLEKRLEKEPPKLTIECPKAVEDVQVSKLLFGLSDTMHEDLVKKIKATVADEIQEQNKELIKLVHLEFLNSYKTQQTIMDVTCPNVFILKPKDRSLFTKSIETHEFELQLWCQKPGGWHPVEGGKYTINIPKKLLVALAPYYNKVMKYMKLFAPAIIPIGSNVLSEIAFSFREVTDEIGLGEKGVSKLGLAETEALDFKYKDLPRQITGAELRLIRHLLKEKDPSEKWGGLERTVTPEGHILWLCPEHKAEYEM